MTHAAVQIEVSFSGVAFRFDPRAALDERHPASLAKRGGKGGDVGGRPPCVLYLTIQTGYGTNGFLQCRLNILFPSVPPLLCFTVTAATFFSASSSPFCPFRASRDGLNQSFVSLSSLPGLSVLFCIQNLNFDPPTTCQTVDMCVASRRSIQVHIKRCVCDPQPVT